MTMRREEMFGGGTGQALQERRARLEESIRSSVIAFQLATGLLVTAIDVPEQPGPVDLGISTAEVRVELPRMRRDEDGRLI